MSDTKLMTTRTILLAAATTGILIGAATVNQMYVSSAMIGDAGRVTGTVIFDPPFTMTRDAKGMVHVGEAIPRARVETFPLSTGVISTGYTFTLAHTPAAGSIMLVMLRSSRIGEDYVTAVVPATDTAQPRILILTVPPASHPLTETDTLTVAYWSLDQ